MQQALQELDEIPFRSPERFGVDREAYLLAGAVAPDLARQRRFGNEQYRQHDDSRLISVLLGHGHVEAAVDLLLSYDDADSYPIGAVGEVMRAVADDEVKLALLQRALEVWLGRPTVLAVESSLAMKSRRVWNHSRAHDLVRLFAWHWQTLPSEEALHAVRSVVSRIVQDEDVPTQAQFDPENRVMFTSGRQHLLFEILHILKQVDAGLASTLVPRYTELAAAAALFPFGQESVSEAWEAISPVEEPEGINKPCVVLGGSEKQMDFSAALVDGQQLKRFERAVKQAQAFLDDDLQDNLAMKECWPSTQAFRRLMYSVGEALGEAGLKYLKQTSDSDVRLFAQIEFAAALAGAPQLSGTESTASRRECAEWELTND